MSDVLIRPARPEDAAAMHALAFGHKINEEKSPQYGQTGYLIWPLPEESYVQRITQSGYTLVAEQDNDILGFVMSGKLEDFKKMTSSTGGFVDKLSKLYSGDTVFIDQIAMRKSQLRAGIGSRLISALMAGKPQARLWIADIIHAPVRNEASIGFFTGLGFKFAREMDQDEWTLGVYEKTTGFDA